MARWLCFGLIGLLATAPALPSQAQQPLAAIPRTHEGRPDFGGVWLAAFLTPLERRRPDLPLVVVGEALAAAEADQHAWLTSEEVEDPDVAFTTLRRFTVVRGEARTSVIAAPADGKLPFTPLALAMSREGSRLYTEGLDDPEQRPIAERCLGGFIQAPIRPLPIETPFQFIQTPDALVLTMEDPAGLRIVAIGDPPLAPPHPSIEGASHARWHGDTLVIRTTAFRADAPSREVFGRPMPVSPDSVVTERFTAVSADELNYQFTIEDPALYATQWMGEFSFTRTDLKPMEYACHEANYTMTNVLLAGRMADLKSSKR